MSNEDVLPIFNVKVKLPDGKIEERKAIDLVSLSDWIDSMIMSSNPFMKNDNELEQLPIGDYKGMVARQIVSELNVSVKKALGLLKEPEPTAEVIVEEKKTEKPKQKPIPKSQPEPEPEPESEPEPEKEDDDEVITID